MTTTFNKRPVEVAQWERGDMGPLIVQAYFTDDESYPLLSDEECDRLSAQMYRDGEWVGV